MTRAPVLLDTNVASFVYGKRPQVALYADDLRGRRGLLAFQTVAEMLCGADAKGWGAKKRRELAEFLENYKIVHTTREMLSTWGHIKAATRRAGVVIETADLWIAATAITLDTTLVAHDAVFQLVPGLRLITHVDS